jgi:hypothetical protein
MTLALMGIALVGGVSATAAQPAAGEARLAAAAVIQGRTLARLGVLGDAFSCSEARLVSFRRSNAEPEITDQWYVASQLWADAVLLEAGQGLADWDPGDTRCQIDKGFVFLDRLWDYANSGYFARANPVGTRVEVSPRFTDDNLVAGLALLATARTTTTEPLSSARYVHAAQREADFLLRESGLWDTTFGGGFWWNTTHGETEEGKPAQTNALAALFFARLYDATGDPMYREWASRSLLWLDTILYEPSRHLYRWSVSFEDLKQKRGSVIHPRYFNYDQSIAVEAGVEVAAIDGDAGHLARARDVARALHDAFWSRDGGGYNLEAGIEQVYTSFGAWTSLGHLALYQRDRDPAWLDVARSNADALATRLRESDEGYALRSYRCVDRVAPGCETGTFPVVVDRTRDTAAQAWVQHLQTRLGMAEMAQAY